MSAYSRARRSGFTLVELLIGVAVLSILLTIAVPNFRTWTVNSQIRNAAESVQNGLQRARAEAVARNANVEFSFVGDSASTSWEVRLPDGTVIDARPGSEGSKAVKRKVAPLGAKTLTYNNFGLPTANSGAAAAFTLVELDSTELDPDLSRELNIVIVPGGSVRMCDAHAQADSPSAC